VNELLLVPGARIACEPEPNEHHTAGRNDSDELTFVSDGVKGVGGQREVLAAAAVAPGNAQSEMRAILLLGRVRRRRARVRRPARTTTATPTKAFLRAIVNAFNRA
jgi:hypothetical protein